MIYNCLKLFADSKTAQSLSTSRKRFLINELRGFKSSGLHLPLNTKTKYLIAKKELSQMKNTCILVNTARGGIINEEDLHWALKNKVIHSAGLDVFEQEPPKENNPLFEIDNLILSPHNAALTLECKKRMGVETCQNIVNYLNNRSKLVLSNIVNREILNLD